MESCAVKRNSPLETQYSITNSESSESDYASTPSSDLNDESQERNLKIDGSASNSMAFHRESSFARRKVSTCSNTSSTNSTCHSLDEGDSESEINSTCHYSDFNDTLIGNNRYDDIIDRIVSLGFSRDRSNVDAKITDANVKVVKRVTESTENFSNSNDKDNFKLDDINGNYEAKRDKISPDNSLDNKSINESEESDNDNDLVERGPVRPHNISQSHHEKPYYTLNWVTSTGQNVDHNQFYMPHYDCVSEMIQDKSLYEKLDPSIDKLSKDNHFDQSYSNNGEQTIYNDFNAISGWSTPEFNYGDAGTPNSNISGEDVSNAQIPSIVLSDGDSILEKLTSGAYQPAQSICDTASSHHPSPGAVSSEHWPDSPASSQHRVRPSRSHSRASSRAQSPGSSVNIGSPLLHQNDIGSPPQLHPTMGNFRVYQALSSSESSNHSFGDTSSPPSYDNGIDQKAEEQLGVDFDSFSTCYPNYVSSDTLVNTTEIIDAIVNNEIQRVEEARSRCEEENELTQNVLTLRETKPPCNDYEFADYSFEQQFDNNLVSNDTSLRTQGKQGQTIDNIFNDVIASGSHNKSKIFNTRFNLSALSNIKNQVYPAIEITQSENPNMLMNTTTNDLVGPDFYGGDADQFSPAQNLLDFDSSIESLFGPGDADSSPAINNFRTINDSLTPIATVNNLSRTKTTETSPSNGSHDKYLHNTTKQFEEKISGSPFNEFQIPETVSAFRQNHLRKNLEHHVAPWPCLNLPETAASKRLKAKLDPREVEKAMKDLLKRSPEELATQDEDGDTMLMCLVGNPRELEKKKAYLVPLVERLSNVSDALVKTNSRNQDALYLAAMYCPQMAYVTGYLAAIMLQKRIDISQRLYHGQNLVHLLAAKGDTHASVLAELLALKTSQGNRVFDLSQRNYSGKTPLHVAVESHDPTGSGVNSIGVTRLLLHNGADQKVQQTEYRNTALHIAVSLCRDPALIEVLLNNNGHEVVNMPNNLNNTPVHLAFALPNGVPIDKQIQVCINLIQAGGRMDLQNSRGNTPFALVLPERKDTITNIFFKNKNLNYDFSHR
ncbi:uncharacterized protein [Venturia canescens]|uniref:uncharacterized protein n=1 Tax=Venturia canescens TaxID=32260 RepID=UPI001C9C90C2|nr:uncharacterized protein LOC122417036 [Venturia canescens]XP_043286203.1 uncharacterized protein LOC122417036 [Venturia canescens]XP_043286204.1 uncharacterized protein LOC122417036 [Venturia canescens]